MIADIFFMKVHYKSLYFSSINCYTRLAYLFRDLLINLTVPFYDSRSGFCSRFTAERLIFQRVLSSRDFAHLQLYRYNTTNSWNAEDIFSPIVECYPLCGPCRSILVLESRGDSLDTIQSRAQLLNALTLSI